MGINVERFWAKVDKGDSALESCWLWTGAKMRGPSGLCYVDMVATPAHRVSYYLAHGRIEKGRAILHLCDNRMCVNPKHLVEDGNPDDAVANQPYAPSPHTPRGKGGKPFYGVIQEPDGRFRAHAVANGVAYDAGVWDTLEEAEAAKWKVSVAHL